MDNWTDYERAALAEIEEWSSARGGWISKAASMAGRPLGWAAERVVPNPVTSTISKAVLGALEMLRDASQWTYRDAAILEEAGKVGLRIESVPGLAEHDLEQLDRLARRFFATNKTIAALEGAGCGMGGVALIAMDVPALFTVGA